MTSVQMPLLQLPARTAIFHSSPTKTAVIKAAKEDELLGALLSLGSGGGPATPAPAPAATAKNAGGGEGAALGGSVGGSSSVGSSTKPFCTNHADQAVWKGGAKDDFNEFMNACGQKCMGQEVCTETCIQEKQAFTQNCVKCFGQLTTCSKNKCAFQCMGKPHSKKCAKCVKKYCDADFVDCSGIPQSDLPKKGRRLLATVQEKDLAGMLNIAGVLTQQREREGQRRQKVMFDSDGDSSGGDGSLSNALGASAEEVLASESDFKDRPICRDSGNLLSEATNGAVSDCGQIAALCDNAQFGTQLKIACPITCNSLSPKCANCKDKPSILSQATGGKINSCNEARGLCDNPKFGPHLMMACPITCDSCGVQFSTPPPTPPPAQTDSAQEAQILVFNKIQDGSLIEDTGTQVIKTLYNNPKGPKDAVDVWGYAYGFVTLLTSHVTIHISPALMPVVWHRPVGHPFNFREYNPYKAGMVAAAKKKASPSGDDDARSLQEDGGEEIVDDGEAPAYGGGDDAGYGTSDQAYGQAGYGHEQTLYVGGEGPSPLPENNYGKADFAQKYSGYGQGGYGAAQQNFNSGCRRLSEAVKKGSKKARRRLQYDHDGEVAYSSCPSPYSSQAVIPTTIAHIEVPRTTLEPGMTNQVVLGISSHTTKKWIQDNRDVLEWFAYPIAYPLAEDMMKKEAAPISVTNAILAQLDITGTQTRERNARLEEEAEQKAAEAAGGAKGDRKLEEEFEEVREAEDDAPASPGATPNMPDGQIGMDRPIPPTIVNTLGGTIHISASYLFLSVSADVAMVCRVDVNAAEYWHSNYKKMPTVECPPFSMANVSNLKWQHNVAIIIGIGFFFASIVVFAVWACSRDSAGTFNQCCNIDCFNTVSLGISLTRLFGLTGTDLNQMQSALKARQQANGPMMNGQSFL